MKAVMDRTHIDEAIEALAGATIKANAALDAVALVGIIERGLYQLALSSIDSFQAANRLVMPSYVSL